MHDETRPPWSQKLIYWGLILVGSWLALVVFAHAMVNHIAWVPRPSSYDTALPGLTQLTTDQGRVALRITGPTDGFVLLSAHGNAEDIGQGDWQPLQQRQPVGVCQVDYPGYGLSAGSPSMAKAIGAVEAAYRHLVEQRGVSPARIIVHGRSIGSGPAIALAANHPVAGLIVESGFTALFRVMTHFAVIPFDPAPNLDRIRKVEAPILILHSQDDEIIAFHHGEALYRAARAPKQRAWLRGGHNETLLQAAYWDALDAWLEQLRREAESAPVRIDP